MRFMGIASGYLVAQSTSVKTHLFPRSDAGSGPIRSMATRRKGVLMMGMVPKGALPFLPLGAIRWQVSHDWQYLVMSSWIPGQ